MNLDNRRASIRNLQNSQIHIEQKMPLYITHDQQEFRIHFRYTYVYLHKHQYIFT